MKVTLEGQGEKKLYRKGKGLFSFIHVWSYFHIWLLASEPSIGSFEGFDLTNPRGWFGGERFHLACPKLGLGDEICSHTILVPDLISCRRIPHQFHVQIERGRTSWGFLARGVHHPLREDSFYLRRRYFGNSRYWVFLASVLASFLVVSGGISAEGLFVLRLGWFPKRRADHYLEGS